MQLNVVQGRLKKYAIMLQARDIFHNFNSKQEPIKSFDRKSRMAGL